MTIAFVADAHLGSRDGDTDRFLDHLDRLRNDPITHLVLMGDIFRYYIGVSRWEHPFQTAVRRVLADMKRSGITILYLEGNRDFFLKGSKLEESVTRMAFSVRLTIGKMMIHAEHGDLVNRSDYQYRAFRILSRSLPVRLALNLMPEPLLRPIVERAEKRLQETNFSYRTRLPKEHLRRFAEKQGGAGMVILGHFHREWVQLWEGGTLILMPAWAAEAKALLLDPDLSWRWDASN